MASRDRLISASLGIFLEVSYECYQVIHVCELNIKSSFELNSSFQFLANLPLLVACLLTGLPYLPITAPLPSLGVALRCLDWVVGQVVTLLEFHLLLTPAAVLCIVLARWETLATIQDRMDKFYEEDDVSKEREAADHVRDIIEEILEEVTNDEHEEEEEEAEVTSRTKNLLHSVSKAGKDRLPQQNESGYLSELETSVSVN